MGRLRENDQAEPEWGLIADGHGTSVCGAHGDIESTPPLVMGLSVCGAHGDIESSPLP